MNKTLIGNENNIIFYEDENVWLNTNEIANLFNVERLAILKDINNIYNDK